MKAYTIEELTALSDADLNALAAELRGWKLREPSDPTSGSFLNWVDSDGVEQYSRRGWQPASSRDQSGKLLLWATEQFGQDYAFSSDMVSFIEFQAVYDSSEIGEPVEIEPLFTISGNTARAETIAFCAAMQAIQNAQGGASE